MKNKKTTLGAIAYGRDDGASDEIQREVWVINYTGNYLSVGATTSGGLGVWISNRSAKRAGKNESYEVQRFRGILAQVGFWFFKIYLYVYMDGDGLC